MVDETLLHSQRLLKVENLFQGQCNGLLDDDCRTAIDEFEHQSDLLAEELGTFDERTEKNIRTLRLVAQREARLFMQRLEAAGIAKSGYQVKIICGTRTYPEQADLYAQGRSKPGIRVTKKGPGESFHNFGLAWDVGVFTTSGAYLTDKAAYKKVGRIADAPELTWGGSSWRFLFFRDYPHYQLERASQAGLDQLRASFEQGTACPLSV
ncbi:MAG: M15 family metallopeptidase [Thiolinea sp.]